MNDLASLVIISLCTASISYTISTTSIFKWLRELVSPIHPKVEEWIHCPWCLNHWVLFVVLMFTNVGLFDVSNSKIVNFAFSLFALSALGGIIHYVLLRAYEPVAKNMARRQLEKMKNEPSTEE